MTNPATHRLRAAACSAAASTPGTSSGRRASSTPAGPTKRKLGSAPVRSSNRASITRSRYVRVAHGRHGSLDVMPSVLVAMSGGVDSSVAACLLQEQGYDVVGSHMSLVHLDGVEHGCCGPAARADAAGVAAIAGFPFEICDLTDAFETAVIDDFVAEHAAGRTPNPCARCNGEIKFGAFLRRADELGVDLVATGHYVRTDRDAAGVWHLRRGADPAKDQSYMLHMLGQRQLARSVFPVGGLPEARDPGARGAVRAARGLQAGLTGALLRPERRRRRLRPPRRAAARARQARSSTPRDACSPARRNLRLHRRTAARARRRAR